MNKRQNASQAYFTKNKGFNTSHSEGVKRMTNLKLFCITFSLLTAVVLNQISSSCVKQLTTWILDCIWLWSHERTEAAVRCVVDAKTMCSLPAVWPLIQLLCMFPCFLGGSTSTSCGWLQPCRAQNLKERAIIVHIIYKVSHTILSVQILWVILYTLNCLQVVVCIYPITLCLSKLISIASDTW